MKKATLVLSLVLALVAILIVGCKTLEKIADQDWIMDNIPKELRVLVSKYTTDPEDENAFTGVKVIRWAKGQKRGYISFQVWDLMPPVDNNKVGPEYYLMVTEGPNIRRGDIMTMAKRGKRDEIRHYFECYDPPYGKKICGSVGSTYPNVWTRLEWEWEPGSMDFRVNGKSVKKSPVKDYQGQIKELWVMGCPDARRVYKGKARYLLIKTPDKPIECDEGDWEQL